MSKKALKGIDFFVTGVLRTDDYSYVILVDDTMSLYFPVKSGEFHTILIENILDGSVEFNVENYGIYFSFLSMFKAHEMSPTQVFFEIGKRGGISCSMDVVEKNELGIKVSRIPVSVTDSVVLCAIGKMPIVVYGPVGTEFVFKIAKEISNKNIISSICDEIMRSERLAALSLKDNVDE